VGNVGRDIRGDDLEKAFEKYGKIREFAFKSRYAFIVSIQRFVTGE
jgi:RNA recognition motif-containing protein